MEKAGLTTFNQALCFPMQSRRERVCTKTYQMFFDHLYGSLVKKFDKSDTTDWDDNFKDNIRTIWKKTRYLVVVVTGLDK